MLGLRPQSCVPSSSQEGPSSLGMGTTTLWAGGHSVHMHGASGHNTQSYTGILSQLTTPGMDGQKTEDQRTDGRLTLGN